MARPKDNKNLENTKLFREIITNEDKIDKKINELQHLSDTDDYKYRLYLTVNSRNVQEAFYNIQEDMVRMTSDDNIARLDEEWITQLQKSDCKNETNFLFDIDNKDIIESVYNDIKLQTNIHIKRKTPNGYHIVTDTFDYKTIINKYSNKDINIKYDGLMFVTYL